MVGLQTLDLAIGVRVPASQPTTSPNQAATTYDLNHYFAPLAT